MRRLIVFAGFIFIAGCSEKAAPPAANGPQGAIGAIAKMGALATDPIQAMSLSFEGNPAPEEIREKIDAVLTAYGLELNNANRGMAGNTLVALRKENGHSELSILDKMLVSTPENGEKFEAAARRIAAAMSQ